MQEPTTNQDREDNTANADPMEYQLTPSSSAAPVATSKGVEDTSKPAAGGESLGLSEGTSAEKEGGGETIAADIDANSPKKNHKARAPDMDILAQIHRGSYAKLLASAPPYRITPMELAAENENFLGGCIYYDMNNRILRDEITGDYIVVYARPLHSSTGEVDDPNTMIYKLASANRIIAVRENPAHAPTTAQWGQALIEIEKQRLLLNFGEVITHNNAQTTIRCWANAEPGESEPKDFLEHVIHQGVKTSQVEALFGLKTTGSEWAGREFYNLGFYFIEVKVPFFNTRTGKDDVQLIVGAKRPHFTRSYSNMSNLELLRQPVEFPEDEDSYTSVNPEPKSKTKLDGDVDMGNEGASKEGKKNEA